MANTKTTTTATKTNKLHSAFKAFVDVQKQREQLKGLEQNAIANLIAANEGQKSFEAPDGKYYMIREYTIKDKEAADYGEKRLVLVPMAAPPQALRASAKKNKERDLAIAGLKMVAGGDEKRFQKLLAEFETNEAKAAEAAAEESTETDRPSVMPSKRAKATGTGGKSHLSDDIEA